MKGIILSLVLFALLFGSTACCSMAVARRCDTLESIFDSFPSPDEEGAKKQEATERLFSEWEKARLFFSLSVIRSMVREMDGALCRLKGASDTNDRAEYAIALSEARRLLSELRASVLPTLSYIL